MVLAANGQHGIATVRIVHGWWYNAAVECDPLAVYCPPPLLRARSLCLLDVKRMPPIPLQVAMRPAAIFGEFDGVAVPSMIQKAQQGRMLIVGKGDSRMDWCGRPQGRGDLKGEGHTNGL